MVFDLLELDGREFVAKNPESRYVPGTTLAWLKVKQPRYREGERRGGGEGQALAHLASLM
jgi:hypothetical protein